jgi:hypothetical protein
MRQLAEVNDSSITPVWVCEMKNRLTGKTVHVVGPRRLENELLMSFISRETGADCLVTDFNEIEEYLADAAEEPSRLFLIDYREPRLRAILKQASLNGNGSSLARRLLSLFNSGKGNDATERRRAERYCGRIHGNRPGSMPTDVAGTAAPDDDDRGAPQQGDCKPDRDQQSHRAHSSL